MNLFWTIVLVVLWTLLIFVLAYLAGRQSIRDEETENTKALYTFNSAVTGPPGPVGPMGATGSQGPPGPPGEIPALYLSRLLTLWEHHVSVVGDEESGDLGLDEWRKTVDRRLNRVEKKAGFSV